MAVKISDLVSPVVQVPVQPERDGKPATFLPVVGVSLEQIGTMLVRHKAAMLKLMDSQKAGSVDMSILMNEAPSLALDIIAFGADADGQQEDIRRLPAAVQLIALAEIWRLTAPEPKKFFDALFSMVEALTGKKIELPQPSTPLSMKSSLETSPTSSPPATA